LKGGFGTPNIADNETRAYFQTCDPAWKGVVDLKEGVCLLTPESAFLARL
jgi:hypothetical protein